MAAENPIATEVVYEDERVRVWRQLIRSGETFGRHTHERDYVLINVEGEGPIEVAFLDGTGGALGDGLTLRPKRGEAIFVPKGHCETARNEGEDYHAILVEFNR
jgi:mannose-6-phosphate isomerase-like protein (cupin superfamily)